MQPNGRKVGCKCDRSIFELLVLLAALGVIFGGLALMIFLSPWSQTILNRLMAYDVRYAIELLAYPGHSRNNSASVGC